MITDDERIEIEERAAIQVEHLPPGEADTDWIGLVEGITAERIERVKAAYAKIFAKKL